VRLVISTMLPGGGGLPISVEVKTTPCTGVTLRAYCDGIGAAIPVDLQACP
jgi:hypothetical protein